MSTSNDSCQRDQERNANGVSAALQAQASNLGGGAPVSMPSSHTPPVVVVQQNDNRQR